MTSEPASLLAHVGVVLVQTSHAGNIGATARAMKTMGLSRLLLVDPAGYPSAEATAMASGADDLLARAETRGTLAEVLGESRLVIGTSARQRTLRWAELSPREAAGELIRAAREGPVSLVFGRERSGLTNAELEHCQALVTIPANPAYSSLNLAAAVQVLAYELRLAALQASAAVAPEALPALEQPASQHDLEGFYRHLEDTLIDVEFLDPDNPRHLMRRLRRLFGRARLTVNEVNILRGILAHARRGGAR